MMNALLIATVNLYIQANLGYSKLNCKIMPDERPPSGYTGEHFISVWQGPTAGLSDNCLNESFSWNVTLTARVGMVPRDRIGDRVLACEIANTPGPNGAPSFNARMDQLRAMSHMAWGLIQDANNIIVNLSGKSGLVYGFYEPARVRSVGDMAIVGDDWFDAEPGNSSIAIKETISLQEAKRFQPVALYV